MQGNAGDCGYADAANDPWAASAWYMTAKGIFLIPSFPHVVGACTYIDDWSLVPWNWFSQNGAKLKLSLPGKLRASRHHEAPTSTLAEHAQPSSVTLKKGKQAAFMGFDLQWWSEPVSGVKTFQIMRHGQIQQSFTRANSTLMTLLWQQVGYYYACQYLTHAKPYVSMRPTFVDTEVVSADVSISNVDTFINHIDTSYGCDAPIDTRTPITIDIDSGKILAQSDIFDVAPKASTPSNADRETAIWLVKQFKTLYPERMSGIEPTCNFDNPEIWVAAMYYLTPQGIYF